MKGECGLKVTTGLQGEEGMQEEHGKLVGM